MKLRTKYAVVLVVVAVVLSGGIYGGVELYKQQLVEGANDEVEETASRTAAQLDATVRQRLDFVGFVASRPRAASFDRSGPYLREVVDNSRFFAAQLVDANGTVVDFYGDVTGDARQEAIGSDVSNRTYVNTALHGESYVSDVRTMNATGKHYAIFSAPVFEDREIVGVLAMAIYVDETTFFTMVQPLETEHQAVTVRDGGAVIHPQHDSFEEELSRTAVVRSTGWTVTVVQDRSTLLGQLHGLAVVQGVSLLGVLVAVAAFWRWEYRTTVSQIEQLLTGFAALEEGDYGHTVSLTSSDEWRRIGDTFGELARTLDAREAALRAHEQRLEVLNRVLRHNLRNDMTLVLGYAEKVRERTDDPVVHDAAETIHGRAESLVELGEKARRIEALVDAEPSVVRVDVPEVVAEVTADLAAEYPRVTFTTDAATPAVAWASQALDVAVRNVCENVCEHNESADPRVAVTVETGAESITLRVRENGRGIPKHERDVLAAGQEGPLEHGSGLGLWIVHWVVDRSEGDLRFERDGREVVLTFDRASDGPREAGDAASVAHDSSDERQHAAGRAGTSTGGAATSGTEQSPH